MWRRDNDDDDDEDNNGDLNDVNSLRLERFTGCCCCDSDRIAAEVKRDLVVDGGGVVVVMVAAAAAATAADNSAAVDFDKIVGVLAVDMDPRGVAVVDNVDVDDDVIVVEPDELDEIDAFLRLVTVGVVGSESSAPDAHADADASRSTLAFDNLRVSPLLTTFDCDVDECVVVLSPPPPVAVVLVVVVIIGEATTNVLATVELLLFILLGDLLGGFGDGDVVVVVTG